MAWWSRTMAAGSWTAPGVPLIADYACADEGGSGLASCAGPTAKPTWPVIFEVENSAGKFRIGNFTKVVQRVPVRIEIPEEALATGQLRAGLRRLYLPEIACHLYYTFDDSQVIVRAVWGARRRRGRPGPAGPVRSPSSLRARSGAAASSRSSRTAPRSADCAVGT